ncbi:S41 family peptidase [Sporocytophaga myxococcoides]|uniref:S41 family peptidase n=1 Tax=Sporocytophaga myxococcoides TaxID=153721 RepID=UPI0003F9A9B7|nr:S41 family peptidase [Sporocytophaga myxococcoides]
MMKRIFLFLSTVTLSITAFSQSKNVLKDPGFENNYNEWAILNAGDYQTEIVHSGTFALKVSQVTPKFSGAYQIIAFPQGISRVEVSGWMKTENVIQGFSPYWKASIALEIQDEYGQLAKGEVSPVGQQKGSTEWTYYKNSYEILKGASQIKVFCFLSNCTGTAWFDDLNVLFFNQAGDTLAEGLKSIKESKPLVYSKNQLQSDYLEMISYLKSHPAPNEFTSKKEFEKLSHLQFNKIKDSLNLTEFYSICSPVVAKVGCSHTLLIDRRLSILPASSFFPLNVYFENERMYVVKSNELVPELTPGAEIIEINGKPVSEIYSTIYNNIPADGYNKSGKLWYLNNSFSYFYALYYGAYDKYILKYKAFKREEAKVCSFTIADFKVVENKLYDSTKCLDANLCFSILEDKNTAVITIKSFVYYDRLDYFKAFVDDYFQKIKEKNISNLIFDHRGIGGGDPYCSSYLLSYLINKPIKYFDKAHPYYDKLKAPIGPATNAFNGKLFILIDNGGGSTSGHLNALIKYHKLGKFIGQETCATYTCNAASKNFVLSYTKLNLSVAQMTNVVDVKPMPKNRGIIPDYEIKPSLEDVIAGRDVVMDFALRLNERGK